MPFTVIWEVSPIVLIVIVCILLSKKSKLEAFMRELLRSGRIDRDEYEFLRLKNQPMQNPPPMQNPQAAPQRVRVRPLNPPPPPPPNPYAGGNPYHQYNPYNQYNQYNPYMARRAKERQSSSTVLFMLGVGLVILAGILFSTAVWLYMGEIGRILTLVAAALFFFIVSAFAKAKLKLNGTSVAFYALGGAFCGITVIAVGWFELFGGWLAIGGEGAAILFALAALVVAASMAAAVRIYKVSVFTHLTIYPAYLSLLLVILYISGNYSGDGVIFNLLCALVSTLLAAAVRFANIRGVFQKPLKTAAMVIITAHAVIFLPTALFCHPWYAPDYLTAVIYIGQFAAYAVLLRSKLLSAASAATAVTIAVDIGCAFENGDVGCFAAALVLLTFAFIYHFAAPLRTAFSDYLFPAAIFIATMASGEGYAAAVCLILAAYMIFLCCEKNAKHLTAIKLLCALPFAVAAQCIADCCEGSEPGIFIAFAAAALVISAIFSLLRRDTLSGSSYSLAAVITTLFALELNHHPAVIALAVVFFTAVYAVTMGMKNNVVSFAAVGGFYYTAFYCYLQNPDIPYGVYLAVLFAALVAASKLVYLGKPIFEKGERVRFDTFALGAALAPAISWPDMFEYDDYRLLRFLLLLEIAVFFLNLCRKQNSSSFNKLILTLSGAAACTALRFQPFVEIREGFFSVKQYLLPAVIFAALLRLIWRDNKKTAADLSFVAELLILLRLVGDALTCEELSHTLFVAAVSLGLLLFAFVTRNGRQFATSAVTLTGIVLYATRDYLKEIDWWVYLLLAGILLICTAAANEYLKSRGDSVKAKLASLAAWFKTDKT